jgi:hypothetical protein
MTASSLPVSCWVEAISNHLLFPGVSRFSGVFPGGDTTFASQAVNVNEFGGVGRVMPWRSESGQAVCRTAPPGKQMGIREKTVTRHKDARA